MKNKPVKIQTWLYPFSLLYGAGIYLRNKFFDWGWLPTHHFDLPIISIGNLTAGGTGKTPHTEYLINLLQSRYRTAVLSRGYKRRSKGFILAGKETPSQLIGDEPFQMKRRFPNIYVAVDKDRVHGIRKLLKQTRTSPPRIILLDDAFQHRYVHAGLHILLTDYNRLIYQDTLLPAGRLREPVQSKNRAHIIIVTKCPSEMTPMEYRIITKRLNLYPYQKLYFSQFKYQELQPVFSGLTPESSLVPKLNKKTHVLLLSGIASPASLINHIKPQAASLATLTFNDHHFYKKEDLDRLKNCFASLSSPKIIVTTEKDAARLLSHPQLDNSLKAFMYVLPIEVEILQNRQELFNTQIIEYIQEASKK